MSKTSLIDKLTFGEHLDELRKVLVKVTCVAAAFMVVAFCFKDEMFDFLLAPCDSHFVTFEVIRHLLTMVSDNVDLYSDNIELITTDISSQFMAHLSIACYMGILLASPYILYQLMLYVAPALYENEKKYAFRILWSVYLLFFLGMAVSYLLLFPISCRFLSSYNVSQDVQAMITLDSYISLFLSLTVMMGVVFQLPIIAIALSKMGIIDHKMMSTYRRHAFVLILIVAAVITPPDVLTLLIVTIPLYMLYEVSILSVRFLANKDTNNLMIAE